jgi:hypothetical protein
MLDVKHRKGGKSPPWRLSTGTMFTADSFSNNRCQALHGCVGRRQASIFQKVRDPLKYRIEKQHKRFILHIMKVTFSLGMNYCRARHFTIAETGDRLMVATGNL